MKIILEPKELLILDRVKLAKGLYKIKDKNDRPIVEELESHNLVWKHPQEGWDVTRLGDSILKENGYRYKI